ncbi:MAG: hypothetical protein WA087_03205 [Candidatus Saccharimonadales bacterium]
MEQIKQIEKTIEGWLKPLPHLPAEWRKWLGENVWWITGIGVIVDVFVIINIYNAATAINSLNNFFKSYGLATSSGWTISLTVSIVLIALMTVIMAMAVNPLKEHKKKGWDLMFLATGISIASSVLTAVFGGDLSSLLMNLIGAAVGVYVLFELKSHFNSPVAHKAE